ncbi:biopolymer transport protein [Burkholderiales bacterium JOSHI_001]|nr:biopolymer transport protein [Burkholderiales bacterium JOSHI_001]
MARRRLNKQAAHLEITAFINLIVVLVPFLLSTAVFTRLSVLELALPAQNNPVLEQLKADTLQLEVVVRPGALEVGDRIGGLIQRIPDTAKGHDLFTLAAVIVQIKGRFPTQTNATVLAEPDTPYQDLVQVMDALRATYTAQGNKLVRADLFPQIAIGDAPIRVAQK